jgi:hypothetical protein
MSPPIDKRLMGVAFTGGDRFVAVGEGGTILLYDGSSGWIPVDSPTTVNLMDVAFAADGQHGCAVGAAGVVVCTDNGGQSWTRVDADVASHADDLQGVALVGNQGWMAGGMPWSTFRDQGQELVIASTNDYGRQWSGSDGRFEANASFLPMDIDFADAQHGWVVGTNGGSYATTDGGKEWKLYSALTGAPTLYAAAAVKSSGTCWAVAAGGVVARTNMAGGWTTVTQTVTTADLYGLAFAGANVGVAVGAPLTAGGRTAMVAWDAAPPRVSATGGTLARRGRVVTLKVTASAASFALHMRASIVNSVGRAVLVWRSFNWRPGLVCPLKFRCRLVPGAYRWRVTVRDAAGYARTLTRRLTVR